MKVIVRGISTLVNSFSYRIGGWRWRFEHFEPGKVQEQEEIPQLSLHAIMGQTNPKTLWIKGKIKSHEFTILIYSGSTTISSRSYG